MLNKIICITVFLFFLGIAYGNVLEEHSFEDLKLNELLVNEKDSNQCIDLNFSLKQEHLGEGKYNIISLNTIFSPNNQGKAFIKLFKPDGNLVSELKAGEFVNNWGRIILPRNVAGKENLFKLCGETFDSIVGIQVLKNSLIGTYEIPDFSKEDSFSIELNETPYTFEPLEIVIKAKNYGSKDANVKITSQAWDLRAVEISSSKLEFNEVVPAKGEKKFSYTVFPKLAIEMSIPKAVLEYKNIFGETIQVKSNLISIKVQEKPLELSGFILSENKINKTGKETEVKITVKNESNANAENIKLELSTGQGGKLKEEIILINLIEARKETNVKTSITGLKEGKIEVNCKIKFTDQNNVEKEKNCEGINLFFEEEKTDYTIPIAAALLLIGLAIFAFLHFKKSE